LLQDCCREAGILKLKKFLENGGSPNLRSGSFKVLFHLSFMKEFSKVKVLLDAGADAFEEDQRGM
jgi:hypothetical protein